MSLNEDGSEAEMKDKIETLKMLADDASGTISNAMAEKYPLGADFERYQDDIRNLVKVAHDVDDLISLIEMAEEALINSQATIKYLSRPPLIKVEEALTAIKTFRSAE